MQFKLEICHGFLYLKFAFWFFDCSVLPENPKLMSIKKKNCLAKCKRKTHVVSKNNWKADEEDTPIQPRVQEFS